MEHHLEFETECSHCKGTGIYVGIGERDGAGIICNNCGGSGCYILKINYKDFEGMKERDGVLRVYEVNPGITMGVGENLKLEDFGGMPYEDWICGISFKSGMEDRNHTCPAWYYQSANYGLKPKWKECLGIGQFSQCINFNQKQKCWRKWDQENKVD